MDVPRPKRSIKQMEKTNMQFRTRNERTKFYADHCPDLITVNPFRFIIYRPFSDKFTVTSFAGFDIEIVDTLDAAIAVRDEREQRAKTRGARMPAWNGSVEFSARRKAEVHA